MEPLSQSIDIPLLSIDGGVGYIQRGRLMLAPTDKMPEIRVTASWVESESSTDLRDQLSRAVRISEDILDGPWLSGACVSRGHSDVHLFIESDFAFTGHSFQLSLLLGILALRLGTRLRADHLFSAGLPNPAADAPDLVARLRLQEVSDAPLKTEAAAAAGAARLFVACPEDQVVRAQRRYWDGRPEHSCLPIPLPIGKPCEVSALIGLGLDLQPVMARLGPSPSAAVLGIYVIDGVARSGRSEAMQPCVARQLAECRAQGALRGVRIENPERWPMLGSGLRDAEAHLWDVGLHALRVCSDEVSAEVLVKALLSESPSDPVAPAVGSESSSDLEKWMDGLPTPGNPSSLARLIAMISALRHVSHDHSAAERMFVPYVRESFTALCDGLRDHSANTMLEETAERAQNLLWLARGAVELAPDLAGQLAQIAQMRADRPSVSASSGHEVLQWIAKQCRMWDLDDMFRPVLETPRRLSIVFRSVENRAADESHFAHFNNLEAEFAADGVRIRVPSPVLLFEEPRNVSLYCRTEGFKESDRTLAQFNESDVATISSLYASELSPTRIGFDVRRCREPATISWPPAAWPPAIDTMLLIDAMCRFGGGLTPRSVCDAGCGTGLLAIGAAHLWPTLEHAELVDINAYAVKSAQLNVAQDPIASRLRASFRATDFAREEPRAVDVLLANAPYLPDRPIPVAGIELATNGTRLLEAIIAHWAPLACDTFLVCSALAWPEVEHALTKSQIGLHWARVVVRTFVPFRIPWLEPHEQARDFRARVAYYQDVLRPRGLVDVDERASKYADPHQINRLAKVSVTDESGGEEQADRLFRLVCERPRGFRFWHEVRVLQLRSERAESHV